MKAILRKCLSLALVICYFFQIEALATFNLPK